MSCRRSSYVLFSTYSGALATEDASDSVGQQVSVEESTDSSSSSSDYENVDYIPGVL